MRYRALVEAPAGLAAFSLYVHGGKHCRPPISRMGNKAGFSHALAALADIQPGEGAGAYVWAEADADVRALLRVYPDAAALLRIAEIIRGWKDEEPRTLWERLRAERRARGRTPEAGVVALKSVAEWSILATWAYRKGEPDSGFNPGVATGTPVSQTSHGANPRNAGLEAELWRSAVGASRWPPVAVLAALPTADALAGLLGTPGDLDGVLVYMDPPYENTTGYAADLPRPEVVAHALDYARCGARVMVSEAVAVEELVALGWEATDIAHARRGQKRTFARVASEFVTLNFAPARTQERAVQVAMFDAVRA